MKQIRWKELGTDILVDIAASMLIAVGIYNFALNANFPVAGFSGVAIILYHLFGLPVGVGTVILNIPVAIFCYRFLGRVFFFKSVKTMIISSVFIDYIAPFFPVYEGDRLLAALCMGILSGAGYAIVFMRGSSTDISSVHFRSYSRPTIRRGTSLSDLSSRSGARSSVHAQSRIPRQASP